MPQFNLHIKSKNSIKITFLCFSLMFQMVTGSFAYGEEIHFLNNGVTAHRGFSGAYPENTLQSFQQGILMNADWLECDIYKTLDGKLVVIHDSTTGRVADQNLTVADSTWEQLQELDVAYQYRIQQGLTLEECPKTTMPLLEEVLQLVMAQQRTRLSIQPKQDITDDAIATIESIGAEDWVGFNEGSLARVARVKELNSEIPVFYDTNGIDTDAHIAQALTYGFETIVMHYPNITAEDVEKIHTAELQAGAWTVNSSSEMQRLLELGIDRIYTDYPDILHSVMNSMKIPGDANNDGKVDGSDVTILAGNWQVLANATWDMGDFNGDGKVDSSDVTILSNNWQKGVTITSAVVPEPCMTILFAGLLLAIQSVMFFRRIFKGNESALPPT